MTDQKQCTNCKRLRDSTEFIGKKGNITTRCKRCRDKDDRQKKRPEVREKNRIRQREQQYYIKCRQKKREEDEEGFLRHNADLALRWRKNNQEHVTAWRTNNLLYRLRGIKQQANKKGIDWNEEMTNEVCEKLMRAPCKYCEFISTETLNGIDRMDSSNGYSLSNCVSCCKTCNFVKKCLDPVAFLNRCKHISYIHGGNGESNNELWYDSGSVSYAAYKARAEKKKFEFELCNEDFNEVKSNACYYCGKQNTGQHSNGIDRKINGIGYIKANCVACCKECNQMKSSMSDDEFIAHCRKIANTWHGIVVENVFENIPICKSTIVKRQN